MSVTSLAQKFRTEAVAGEYAGAGTVLRFGHEADAAARELDHLRRGCGVFDLGWRGKLVVSGEDRVRWLNGMVSNNTRDLPQDFGNYSFVLNAQGQIQADLMAFQRGDFYLLESEAGQIPAIREIFDRYIIMDDVEIEDIGAQLTSLGVAGPLAVGLLQQAGLMVGELKPGQLADARWQEHGFTLVRDPIALRDWYELWLAPENVEAFWKLLLDTGASPVGADALEAQRILLGLPRVGVDTGGRELAQETGQDYALHSSKGCYLGQEIVERVRARGQLHRSFSGMLLEGPAAARGSKVTAAGKDVGEITSSAEIAVEGVRRSVALGYLKRSAAAAGTSVEIGASAGIASVEIEGVEIESRAAKVVALPFSF